MTIEEIREVLKKPLGKSLISKAIKHENRLKLHCNVTLDKQTSKGVNQFLEWVQAQIKAKDKYAIFLDIFQFPVKTVSLTNKVFEDLKKVFDGKNAVSEYYFSSDEYKEMFLSYLEQYKFNEKWKKEAFEKMKHSIYSLIIIDLESEQTSERPQPYFYFKDIADNIISIDVSSDYTINALQFRENETSVVSMTAEKFQRWKTKPYSIEVEELLFEATHDLGYCPVRFFWDLNVGHPFDAELSNLDELLFKQVSSLHLDSYALYPIVVTVDIECDYSDTEGNECKNGKLVNSEGDYILEGNGIKPCPTCSARNIAGAGTHIKKPMPDGVEGDRELQKPVDLIGADVPTLEINMKKIEKLESKIYTTLTGYEKDAVNKQALNRDQVARTTDAAKQKLLNIKPPLDSAKKWIVDTFALLMFDSSTYKGSVIDSGTEYYMLSPSESLKRYKLALEAGENDLILDDTENEYFSTRYKYDNRLKTRQLVVSDLDPFRHLSKKTVAEMYRNNEIRWIDYFIKMNLSSLLRKFERQNISIVDFGSQLAYDLKIKRIREGLEAYANELKPQIQISTVE